MKEETQKYGATYLRRQKRRKLWHRIVGTMACLVVFVTTYALILPAITMEKTTFCGLEEHQHTEKCYSRNLICGLSEEGRIDEDTGGHIHTEDCYETVLTCPLEEHVHGEACYFEEQGEIEGSAGAKSDAASETGDGEPGEESAQGSEGECGETETEPSTEEPGLENPSTEEGAKEPEQETKPLLMMAAGEDYTVTVSYTEEAELPENATLQVEELAWDSEAFLTELENTNAVLQAYSGEYIQRARYFDITILDEDGNKIEPMAAVNVEIALKDGEQTTENLMVTHTSGGDTSIVENVETREENGDVIASFETDGFSTYGVGQTTNTDPAEIAVGETATLAGTTANYHSWSSANTGVVTVSGSGNEGTVTGVSASENVIIITHKYGEKKNKLNASELFYVKVIDANVDESTLTKGNDGYTVTVKGNKKILETAELFVEEVAPQLDENIDYYSQMVNDIDSSLSTDINDKDTIFNFLKMYHIYLSKDGGVTEYDPTEDENLQSININLQVTITYDSAPEGWPSQNGNLYVGHYKKNTSGIIENKGFTDSTGIKQVKVSGNSMTFHIQSFSIIAAGVLAKPDDSSQTTSGDVELNYSSGTLSEGDIMDMIIRDRIAGRFQRWVHISR